MEFNRQTWPGVVRQAQARVPTKCWLNPYLFSFGNGLNNILGTSLKSLKLDFDEKEKLARPVGREKILRFHIPSLTENSKV